MHSAVEAKNTRPATALRFVMLALYDGKLGCLADRVTSICSDKGKDLIKGIMTG